MDVREAVPEYVQKAVAAAMLFTAFAFYTGEATTLRPILTEFVLYTVVLSIGFAVIDWFLTTVGESPAQD